MAHLAHDRPETLSGLAAVNGLGRAKLKRYGAELLEVLGRSREQPPAQERLDEHAGQA